MPARKPASGPWAADLKLAGPREVAWSGLGHFYVAAAAMRRILVDHVRARAAHGRGGHEACALAASADEHDALLEQVFGGDADLKQPFTRATGLRREHVSSRSPDPRTRLRADRRRSSRSTSP
ncbi:MAG: ECF-type sigma factor [Planctomycetota bacterium]